MYGLTLLKEKFAMFDMEIYLGNYIHCHTTNSCGSVILSVSEVYP